MKVRMSEFVNNCKTVDIVIALNVIHINIGTEILVQQNQGPKTDITGTHI
jgi:hypothetical protein